MKKIRNIILFFYGTIIKKVRTFIWKKKLTNENFTIIAPNCIGGLLYHRLNKQFLSSTINLFFPNKKDYLKFVLNLRHYLSLELDFIGSDFDYPVAMCGDVEIRFNHYKTNEEANEKWKLRKKRVNYDNLFVIIDDVKDIEYKDIVEFNKVNCKGKVFFTAKNYPEFDYALQLTQYKGNDRVGIYMIEKNEFTDMYPFDKDFDFVNWLNTGNVK